MERTAAEPECVDFGSVCGSARVYLLPPRKCGDAYTIIKTPKAEIKVRVTPTGLLRVYMNGMRVLTTK